MFLVACSERSDVPAEAVAVSVTGDELRLAHKRAVRRQTCPIPPSARSA